MFGTAVAANRENSFFMFRNYLKIIFRLIGRQKAFAFINIFGLTIGMIGFILIFLGVKYELDYNRQHEKIDRLYLIYRDVHIDNTTYNFTPVPYPFKEAITADFPEIEKATRWDAWSKFMFRHGDKVFDEPLLMADREVFEMFTFHYLEGSAATALADVNSVAISKRIAEKYFGNEPALGKTFQINGQYDVTVTAVYENLPQNSTLRSDIIMPMDFYKTLGRDLSNWHSNSTWCFVLLQPGADVQAFEQKLKPVLAKKQDSTDELYLHPMKDYYLHGFHYKDGQIKYVYIFAFIGIIIIALAAINYVNLVTARSIRRAKEIGIRKTVGAQKRQVIAQFLSESVLFSFIALNFAVLIVELILPWFNTIVQKQLSIEYTNPTVLFSLITIALITGLTAGAYPALHLSRFNPASVLKNSEKLRGGTFKSALVIVQFAVSIALIITSIVLYKQFTYLVNLPVGFEKENVFYFKLENEPRASFESLKKEFESIPNVIAAGASAHLPTEIGSNGGGYTWEGKDPNQDVLISMTRVDDGFLKTFGMKLTAGRFYEPGEIVIDTINKVSKVVINQKLADIANFHDPIGKMISTDSWRLEVIGVVANFNFQQNQAEVGPLMMFFAPGGTNFGAVKFTGDPATMKAQLEKVYTKMFPQYPPGFSLLDDRFEAYFARESRNASLFGYYTLLAIIISCLGLYGLASFIAEQRRKEMGIRKALGANTSGLSILMMKDFAVWIVIANVIAIPLAWYYSHDALKLYVFKTEISIWIFVAAAVLSLIIAAATVIFQVIRTAAQNPAVVLKYE